MTEQRYFRRIPFQAEVKLITANLSRTCELVDLALTGALVRIPSGVALQHGDRCRLSIFLPTTDLSLEFEAELARCDGENLGFRFVSEDYITLGHLRRLLELNIGDAQEAEEEFRRWLAG